MSKIEQVKQIDDVKVEGIQTLSAEEINVVSGGVGSQRMGNVAAQNSSSSSLSGGKTFFFGR